MRERRVWPCLRKPRQNASPETRPHERISMPAATGSRAGQDHPAWQILLSMSCPWGGSGSRLARKRSGRERARFLSSVARRFGADCLLKVFGFLTAAGAKFCEDGALFLGLFHIAGLDIKLAEVFAGGLVIRLEFQRLGIVGQRRLDVAGLAQGIAQQIVDVGLLYVLGEVPQFRERGGGVLCLYLGADGGEIGRVGR